MSGNIDCEPLVRSAGDTGHQDQMARGADGQELGNALDQGKNDDMQQRQPDLPQPREAARRRL